MSPLLPAESMDEKAEEEEMLVVCAWLKRRSKVEGVAEAVLLEFTETAVRTVFKGSCHDSSARATFGTRSSAAIETMSLRIVEFLMRDSRASSINNNSPSPSRSFKASRKGFTTVISSAMITEISSTCASCLTALDVFA